MTDFIGDYTCRLDDKGRLAVALCIYKANGRRPCRKICREERYI